MSDFEEQLSYQELAAEEKLARAHADLYNLNQEYSNFVRRSKELPPATSRVLTRPGARP